MKAYTLERDVRPPHLNTPKKVCKRCGVEKSNTFGLFPKVPFRTQRYGPRHTTSSVCNTCMSEARRKAAADRRQRDADADALAIADAEAGRYLK